MRQDLMIVNTIRADHLMIILMVHLSANHIILVLIKTLVIANPNQKIMNPKTETEDFANQLELILPERMIHKEPIHINLIVK